MCQRHIALRHFIALIDVIVPVTAKYFCSRTIISIREGASIFECNAVWSPANTGQNINNSLALNAPLRRCHATLATLKFLL
jgi:hypothetical protein